MKDKHILKSLNHDDFVRRIVERDWDNPSSIRKGDLIELKHRFRRKPPWNKLYISDISTPGYIDSLRKDKGVIPGSVRKIGTVELDYIDSNNKKHYIIKTIYD